jgi:hypothetical protein
MFKHAICRGNLNNYTIKYERNFNDRMEAILKRINVTIGLVIGGLAISGIALA